MSSIPNLPDTCPIDIDETAEAYIRERLSPADTLRFEYHRLRCRHCAAAAKEADWFVRGIRGAAQRLVAEPRDRLRLSSHVSLSHITPMPLGGFCAQMRFDVTICQDPDTRQ